MPKKIIIVRHGETDYNVEHRMQGWLDVPLNENGMAQAKASSTKFIGLQINAIYSSDLVRAHATAKHISEVVGAQINLAQALRERDMGIFSGWSWDSSDQEKSSLWSEFEYARDNQNDNWNKHGGESMHQMKKRIRDFMEQVHNLHKNETVVLVTHGGTINTLLELYKLKEAKEGFRPIKNASLLVLHKVLKGYRLEEI